MRMRNSTAISWTRQSPKRNGQHARRRGTDARSRTAPICLQLGRGVLPSTTLQVHYRSKYRELITYSNAAFYRGALSVPVRHPDDEIRRVRPIEVIRVDGMYEAQTNKAEEVLAEIWSGPLLEKRPTVGVVTFNRKQADLVEDAIDKRAKGDPSFLHAYERECERMEHGEDVGFFVKNVENVQGDERDIIIFTSTFGPNARTFSPQLRRSRTDRRRAAAQRSSDPRPRASHPSDVHAN